MNPNLPPQQQGNQQSLQDMLLGNMGTTNPVTNPNNAPYAQPNQGGNVIVNAKNDLGNVLGFALPTVGAIGGEAIWGPVGAGIGAGGMQALTDLMQGKKPGKDVLTQGGFALAGGALGKFLPAIFGKALSNMGESAATGGLNLTTRQIGKFAIDNKIAPSQVLAKFGLTGTDLEGLQTGLQKANQEYDAIANTNAPASQQAFINNVNEAKKQILGDGQGIVPSAATKTWNSLHDELKENVYPYMNVAEDEEGNLTANNASQPTMSDVLKGKQNYAKMTTNSQFAADPANYGTNRWAGNILRGTLNDSAVDQGLKQQGIDLMNLHDLSDIAQSRAGAGQSWLGFGNIVRKGIGAGVGSMFGNPLLGMIGEAGAESALKNPILSKIIAGSASKMGAGLSAASNPLGILGAAGLPLAANSLGATGAQNSNQSTGNQSQYSGNQVNTSTSTLAQTGANVNTTGQNPSIGVNQNITLSTGEQLPAQLPDAAQLGNTIPGQIYTPSQQAADIQKWTEYAANNPYNPGIQTQAQLEISKANDLGSLNNQIVSTNLQQTGLTPQQSGFIMTAAPTWSALTDLHQAINSTGGSGIFNYIINSNPQAVAARAATDPQFGHMVQLMNYAKEEVGRMYSGGALTDTQATMFKDAFTPSNSIATNNANLEQVMKQIFNQYKQYAPFFHMQQNAPQSQISKGSNLLNNLLGQAGGNQ